MNDFYEAFAYVNKLVYEPNQFTVKAIQEEVHNKKYGAGTFHLMSKTVRFRVAHQTPTKIGQFVSLWEKDTDGKNRPYSYEASPDLIVITTFRNERQFGQFIFPKEVLFKRGILHSPSTKGKMAMRVYPCWDEPNNKQAISTQNWQLPYFIDMSNPSRLPLERLKKLYRV
ncbi:MepB family protein [Geomicrobium sp. JCM 19038]|uniref:MepB family protein n=1 Tax=Geomicrobium sp. JCM 19038 TaxID=1460635 RepID=UPI00045F1179|nr:MepB family protein [Geomicrobium sp. JCM 19038]GAK08188.1 hypothetical protein JCM19038_1963 [Geomicrobium sp. JCM 19038]